MSRPPSDIKYATVVKLSAVQEKSQSSIQKEETVIEDLEPPASHPNNEMRASAERRASELWLNEQREAVEKVGTIIIAKDHDTFHKVDSRPL